MLQFAFQVFKLLRSQENEVTLEICPPDDSSGRISVELDRGKGPLGIRIRQDQGLNLTCTYCLDGYHAQ